MKKKKIEEPKNRRILSIRKKRRKKTIRIQRKYNKFIGKKYYYYSRGWIIFTITDLYLSRVKGRKKKNNNNLKKLCSGQGTVHLSTFGQPFRSCTLRIVDIIPRGIDKRGRCVSNSVCVLIRVKNNVETNFCQACNSFFVH